MKRRDTPEIRAARDFFAYLRRLDLKRMEAETLDVLDRASRTPHATVDGYPTSTLGGGSGKGTVSRPTEVAAFAPPTVDPIHDHALTVLGCLTECYGASAQLMNTLAKIARISDAPVTRKTCELCGDDGDLVWGTVNGVLPESHDLCRRRCYHFVRDNKGWPSVEQTSRFQTTGKWRVRVA